MAEILGYGVNGQTIFTEEMLTLNQEKRTEMGTESLNKRTVKKRKDKADELILNHIRPNNVEFYREGDDGTTLRIEIMGYEDAIRIRHFYSREGQMNRTLVFSDEVFWQMVEKLQNAKRI